MVVRVHITGASGAGVSTLGRALATHCAVPWHDTDDFYWFPTDPPFQHKRPIAERLSLLRRALDLESGFVSSGSLDGWGDPLIPRFAAVIFLRTPTDLRLARLRARETATFGGAAVAPGGAHYADHEAFMEWAADYDTGLQSGRNLQRHLGWLDALACPVLRLDGSRPTADMLVETLAFLNRV